MGLGKQNTEGNDLMSLWPEGLGGVSRKGVFGSIPAWVNPKLAPGHTSQVELLGLGKTVREIATLNHFIFSPNLVWFAVALVLHVFVPYDFEAAKTGFWPCGWLLKRSVVHPIPSRTSTRTMKLTAPTIDLPSTTALRSPTTASSSSSCIYASPLPQSASFGLTVGRLHQTWLTISGKLSV